jgi:hypothetical protein
MTEREMDELKRLLKRAVPPVGKGRQGVERLRQASTELRRDLWPEMRRRLEERTVRVRVRVPWWDWALLAGASLLLLLFPGVIPALLYHL